MKSLEVGDNNRVYKWFNQNRSSEPRTGVNAGNTRIRPSRGDLQLTTS